MEEALYFYFLQRMYTLHTCYISPQYNVVCGKGHNERDELECRRERCSQGLPLGA